MHTPNAAAVKESGAPKRSEFRAGLCFEPGIPGILTPWLESRRSAPVEVVLVVGTQKCVPCHRNREVKFLRCYWGGEQTTCRTIR